MSLITAQKLFLNRVSRPALVLDEDNLARFGLINRIIAELSMSVCVSIPNAFFRYVFSLCFLEKRHDTIFIRGGPTKIKFF